MERKLTLTIILPPSSPWAGIREKFGIDTNFERIEEFEDAIDAMAAIQARPPSVVIVAEDSEVGFGTKLVATLKRHLPTTKIVVVTNRFGTQHYGEFLSAGATAYLHSEDLTAGTLKRCAVLAEDSDVAVVSRAALAHAAGDSVRVLVPYQDNIAQRGLYAMLRADPRFIVTTTERAMPPRGVNQPTHLVVVDRSAYAALHTDELAELRAAGSRSELVFLSDDRDPSFILPEIQAQSGEGLSYLTYGNDGDLCDVLYLLGRCGLSVFDNRASAQLRKEVCIVASDQESVRGGEALTSRQLEVLAMVGRGLSNARIAECLFISTRTVEYHIEQIKQKLRLGTRAELVAIAAQRNMLSQNAVKHESW